MVKEEQMLKACAYCGRIHDKSVICPQKQKVISRRETTRERRDTEQAQLRNSNRWKIKTGYIKGRDMYLCQACINGIGYLPGRRIATEGLQVHHIVPIKEDRERAFDNENLITLCEQCHKLAETGKIRREKLQKIAKNNENMPPGL